MEISIIIPTHGKSSTLWALLSSIAKQRFQAKRAEVLVVCNFPNHKIKSKINKFKAFPFQLKYYCNHQKGANAARNFGIKKSSGEVLLLLDDDCVLTDENYLTEIVRKHKNHPDVTGIGGSYSQDHRSLNQLQKAYNINANQWLYNSMLDGTYTHQLIGGNASYKAKVFYDRIKFDENIYYGGTESELNFRLIQQGHKLLLDKNLVVAHLPKMNLYDLARKAYLQGVGKRYINKFFENNFKLDSKNSFKDYNKLIQFYLKTYQIFFDLGYKKPKQKPIKFNWLTFVVTYLNFILWLLFWPLRKVYYFLDYQYKKINKQKIPAEQKTSSSTSKKIS